MNIDIVLIILVFITGLLGIISERYIKKKNKKISRTVFLGTILLLTITFCAYLIQAQQQEFNDKYSSNSGELSGTLTNDNITYPSLSLGTAQFIFEGKKGDPLILVGNDPITIWIENGELKLSTIIRSSSGEVIAKIEANEWQVNPNQIFDRNFDDHALEVINQNDEVVLQADFDGKTVHFVLNFFEMMAGKLHLVIT